MKILFSPAHYYISDKTGSEASWAYMAMSALAKAGHQVNGICGVADLAKPLPKGAELTILFGHRRSQNALVEYKRKIEFHRAVATWTAQQLSLGDIEVVHHFAPISPQSPNFLAARGKIKIPFTMGPAMIPAPPNIDLDVALGVKKDWRFRLTQAALGLVNKTANNWHQQTLQHTDHLFAVTTEATRYYAKFMSPQKISLVPAGIDVSKYTLKIKPKHNSQIILALCYLIKRKGIDVLLKAFAMIAAKHPQARLWIVGSGPEEAALKQLASELKITDQVRFWGFVDNKQVAKYYAEAGVFVSPTRNEPFGQTFLEAMAAGVPIVATKTGGIPDIVTADVGYTFPVDDVSALAEILHQLVGRDDRLTKLGQAAIKRVHKYYDWSVIMDQYVTCWQKLQNSDQR